MQRLLAGVVGSMGRGSLILVAGSALPTPLSHLHRLGHSIGLAGAASCAPPTLSPLQQTKSFQLEQRDKSLLFPNYESFRLLWCGAAQAQAPPPILLCLTWPVLQASLPHHSRTQGWTSASLPHRDPAGLPQTWGWRPGEAAGHFRWLT